MMTRKIGILGTLVLVAGLAGLGWAADTSSSSPAALEQLWADLASADEATVTRAILGLGKNPQQTLTFLKDRLPPVKGDPKRVAQWIADLDSSQFAVRQRATEELEYQGKYIQADLTKALAAGPALQTKQQLQQLLDRMPQKIADPKPLPGQGGNMSVVVVNGRTFINGVPVDGALKPARVGPSMTWVRAVRSIALLESIGTQEAKQLLESLASGEPDALPTEQARAAFDRLNKR